MSRPKEFDKVFINSIQIILNTHIHSRGFEMTASCEATDRLSNLLRIASVAIDSHFGQGYAMKNPKLVSDVAALADKFYKESKQDPKKPLIDTVRTVG